MSHEIETMAWTNEVPWHGLGVKVDKAPNVAAMIKLAGLDWKVEKRPMFYTTEAAAKQIRERGKCQVDIGKNREVPDAFALVRDKDGKVLDVCGSKYMPAQNEEVFEFLTDFVEAGNATMETAGSLRGGQYVWGLANLKTSFKLDIGKGKKDEVKGYLLVGVPHKQGKTVIIKVTNVRVVCNNTLQLALKEGGDIFKHAHRSAFTRDTIKRAKEVLGLAREKVDEFHEMASALVKMRIDIADGMKLIAPVFAPKLDLKELDMSSLPPRLQAIFDASTKAPGALPGTGYGLLNAVTYYTDHMASRTADKRVSNAFFGKTSNQKVEVLNALMSHA